MAHQWHPVAACIFHRHANLIHLEGWISSISLHFLTKESGESSTRTLGSLSTCLQKPLGVWYSRERDLTFLCQKQRKSLMRALQLWQHHGWNWKTSVSQLLCRKSHWMFFYAVPMGVVKSCCLWLLNKMKMTFKFFVRRTERSYILYFIALCMFWYKNSIFVRVTIASWKISMQAV